MAEAIAFDIAKAVLNNLSSLALQEIGLWWNFKDELEGLQSLVSAIQAVLLDAEEKSVTSHLVKDWLGKLKDALYDADDLLDDFSTEALRQDLLAGNKLTKKVRIFFSGSNQFAYGLKMGHRVKAIKAKLKSIESEMKMLNLVERDRPAEVPFMAKRRQQGHSFVSRGEIIGRDDDKKSLLKLLLEFQSEENVFIVPIIGVGGLGKTALAQLVYNDDVVEHHFELRMWVCVSDVFDVKVIVKDIIKSVTNQPVENLEMEQLQKQLRDKIDGKKYLLVLDDVWNEEREKWFNLKKLLMGGAKGSRIIVTTRSQRVAKVTTTCQPHVLKGLAVDDAWSLFKEIAFEQRPADSMNSTFVEIGKTILEKCGGVPLVIRTIAGTLSSKKSEKEWLSFKDNELAKVSIKEGEILPTLKLSYDHLPSHLKHCFAYCRLYPKDHVIDVPTLIKLWIAQGFVKPSNPSQFLEDIGFGYFDDLVERSFFQEVEKSYWSGFMDCKMHDLMHDLAEAVAGTESIIVDSDSSISEITEKCRHASIDFLLIPSHETSIPFFKAKKLRSLLRLWKKRNQQMSDATCDSIISSFKCLRVLELDYLNLSSIPRSIHKLKHLRYLNLSGNVNLETLPESIGKLQNLQVLKLDYCGSLKELPKKVERLVNLSHLANVYCSSLTHMPRGIRKLTSLQTLSEFVVDKHGSHSGADLSELSGLNNLSGELRIKGLGDVKNAKKEFRAANLKEKQHLESLILDWIHDVDEEDSDDDEEDNEDDEKSLEDLQPHPNLKRLSVGEWKGDAKFPSWLSSLTNLTNITISYSSKFKHLPTFAQLPHLEKLEIKELTELEYMDDNGPNGRPGESELFFPSLTHLSLDWCPNLKSWWRRRNDDDKYGDQGTATGALAFPRLSYLSIVYCPLDSMPLYPSLQKGLVLWRTSTKPLKQTIQMNITNTAPSTSSLPLSRLEVFSVEGVMEQDSDLLHECLQNMTSLKDLRIRSYRWLKSLSSFLQNLTGLQHLKIEDCKELDLDGTQWEALRNLSSLNIENIPRLLSLPLELQHLIELKTLQIQDCGGLTSLFPGFQHLTALEELSISSCEDLELSAPDTQIFQDYRSLRTLRLRSIPKCRQLPEWIQRLTNLRSLNLCLLPNLISLPDEMRCLTTLEELSIFEVPQLKERCQKDIGADWPKIAHISEIWLDHTRVQYIS